MLEGLIASVFALLQTAAPLAAPPTTAAKPAPAAPAAAAPAAAAKPAAAAPARLDAAQVVAGVQKYYQTTQKLQADFKQTYTNTVFGRTSDSYGKVYIEKPGKMRWDYSKPDKKYFISDGTTLWVYEPANKQAFKQSLKDQVLPIAITFLYGEGDLRKDFTASLDPGKYGAAADYVVKLVPKQPSAQYKTLWLVVDPTDFHVKESIILEASDNLNRFRYTNMKMNEAAKFQAKHFKFVPPAGVKVITPSEQQAGQAGAPGAP